MLNEKTKGERDQENAILAQQTPLDPKWHGSYFFTNFNFCYWTTFWRFSTALLLLRVARRAATSFLIDNSDSWFCNLTFKIFLYFWLQRHEILEFSVQSNKIFLIKYILKSTIAFMWSRSLHCGPMLRNPSVTKPERNSTLQVLRSDRLATLLPFLTPLVELSLVSLYCF